MKRLLNLIFVCLMFVVINVSASTPTPAPTPPVAPPVVKQHTEAPAKTLTFLCPEMISVAPSPIPAGWMSLSSITRHRQSISVDAQKPMVVCWYGTAGDTNFFGASLLGQNFPADYECKIPGPGVFRAICDKKIRIVR